VKKFIVDISHLIARESWLAPAQQMWQWSKKDKHIQYIDTYILQYCRFKTTRLILSSPLHLLIPGWGLNCPTGMAVLFFTNPIHSQWGMAGFLLSWPDYSLLCNLYSGCPILASCNLGLSWCHRLVIGVPSWQSKSCHSCHSRTFRFGPNVPVPVKDLLPCCPFVNL
jgi:hypothetical protein